MKKRVSQLEREFLQRKVTGATAQTPLNQLQRTYYATYVGGDNAGKSVGDLEWAWMIKYITTALGTVTEDDTYASLWEKMVIAVGGVPSGFLNQNIYVFYSLAP